MRNMSSRRFLAPVVLLLSLISGELSAQTGALAVEPAYRGKLRAYLGVYLGDAPLSKGALVGKVVEDSPAGRAGLRVNDILLSFEHLQIENAAHVYKLLGEIAPNRALSVTVLRGGGTLTFQVTLGERQGLIDACQRLYAPADLHQAEADRLRQLAAEARQKGNEEEARKYLKDAAEFTKQSNVLRENVDKAINEKTTPGIDECRRTRQPARPQLGLTVLPLNEQLAQFFKVPTGTGLLITEVKPGSLAEQNGLLAGDCLLALNGKPISTLAEMQRLLSRLGEASLRSVSAEPAEIGILIVREGQEKTLAFKL